jgi:hypothetical protein
MRRIRNDRLWRQRRRWSGRRDDERRRTHCGRLHCALSGIQRLPERERRERRRGGFGSGRSIGRKRSERRSGGRWKGSWQIRRALWMM